MPEKEYIEREAVNNVLDELMVNDSLYNALQDIHAADVIPVVRCKDCIYYPCCCRTIRMGGKRPDDFCSFGERKEVDNG